MIEKLVLELLTGREQKCISSLSYLIANGFGATPLQEDLFYTTGTGHAKALRPLQFRLRVFWPVGDKHSLFYGKIKSDKRWKSRTYFVFCYFIGSEFILSNKARFAWAPLERGSVWDFFTSCLKSPPTGLFALLWRNSGRQHETSGWSWMKFDWSSHSD